MMLIGSTESKLAALLIVLLVCKLSCVETSGAYDASQVENGIESSDKDYQAVEATQAPKLSSERPEEMENSDKKIEEFVNETLAADERNSSEIHEHLWPVNSTLESAENKSCTTGDCSAATKPRWNCSLMSLFGENEEPKVVILKNETELAKIISKSNESQSCFLLYFFVNWCDFCAEFSVEINAIGRSFYGLPVIAVDAYFLSSIAGKFGITGVPCLILFHDGRPVAKFNKSRALQSIEDFITNSTGLAANKSVEIHDEDFIGPLPTKIEAHGDIYLVLSVLSIALILFVNLCFTDRVSTFCLSYINRFKEWAVHQKTD